MLTLVDVSIWQLLSTFVDMSTERVQIYGVAWHCGQCNNLVTLWSWVEVQIGAISLTCWPDLGSTSMCARKYSVEKKTCPFDADHFGALLQDTHIGNYIEIKNKASKGGESLPSLNTIRTNGVQDDTCTTEWQISGSRKPSKETEKSQVLKAPNERLPFSILWWCHYICTSQP